MANYRVLCLERGRVAERSDYIAEDDGEALALFVLRRETADCELWCGERLVAAIPREDLSLPRQKDTTRSSAGTPLRSGNGR